MRISLSGWSMPKTHRPCLDSARNLEIKAAEAAPQIVDGHLVKGNTLARLDEELDRTIDPAGMENSRAGRG